MYKSTVTSKGQITIPEQIREHLAIMVGDNIIFNIIDDYVQIQRDTQIIKWTSPIKASLFIFAPGSKDLTINV